MKLLRLFNLCIPFGIHMFIVKHSKPSLVLKSGGGGTYYLGEYAQRKIGNDYPLLVYSKEKDLDWRVKHLEEKLEDLKYHREHVRNQCMNENYRRHWDDEDDY